MTTLLELRAPKQRFARSINLERDIGSHAIDGYLPVGRALDVIGRLALALIDREAEIAFSVTGPYGSGKSSLALVIDALLGPAGEHARSSAEDLLRHAAPSTLATIESARQKYDADRSGFVRAVATAQREPIVSTVLRALISGLDRFPTGPRQ